MTKDWVINWMVGRLQVVAIWNKALSSSQGTRIVWVHTLIRAAWGKKLVHLGQFQTCSTSGGTIQNAARLSLEWHQNWEGRKYHRSRYAGVCENPCLPRLDQPGVLPHSSCRACTATTGRSDLFFCRTIYSKSHLPLGFFYHLFAFDQHEARRVPESLSQLFQAQTDHHGLSTASGVPF